MVAKVSIYVIIVYYYVFLTSDWVLVKRNIQGCNVLCGWSNITDDIVLDHEEKMRLLYVCQTMRETFLMGCGCKSDHKRIAMNWETAVYFSSLFVMCLVCEPQTITNLEELNGLAQFMKFVS